MEVKNTINSQPADDSFKIHFEALLNPIDLELPELAYTGVYMPIADNPVQPREVFDVVRKYLKNCEDSFLEGSLNVLICSHFDVMCHHLGMLDVGTPHA